MVLYFSGTGNSQLVALQIAAMIGDETVSINRYLKSGEKAVVRSERPLVFVAPTYCWRIPRVVERWILEADFKGNQRAYFVLTCGADCGNAGRYARKLCAQKGFEFFGLAPLPMPENYLALFPTPGTSECQAIVENARAGFTALGAQIQASQHFKEQPVSFGDKMKSGPVNPLFYAFIVKDKGFTVSETCISCGKCAGRCTLNNITITDGRPVWKGNCTHCMACIGGCPTEAIEYKDKSKGQHRHYIMDDSLCLENGGQKK